MNGDSRGASHVGKRDLRTSLASRKRGRSMRVFHHKYPDVVDHSIRAAHRIWEEAPPDFAADGMTAWKDGRAAAARMLIAA